MNILASKRYQRVTNLALAALIVVSTITASVPFLFSEKANAVAPTYGPYSLSAEPYCNNGLVSFNIKGNNTDQRPIYVRSSADFALSAPVFADSFQQGVSIPLNTTKASVPASAVTVFESDADGNIIRAIDGAVAPYDAFNCYDTVYVAPVANGGSDSNQGTTAATPFATIQKALDTVNANGTVRLSAGTFPQERLTIVKNGTTILGQGRDATKITVLSNASGQGLLAEGLNNITIKSLGVVGSGDGTAASGNALIKLANGQNGIIENVQVESATNVRTKATGIDINGYANVRIDNVYVHGLGKDGISVTAKTAGQTYNTDGIRIQGAAVADVSWAAIAFYTSKDVKNAEDDVIGHTPTSNITNVSFGGTSTLQYNDNGIYFEGLAGNTITGANGVPVSIDGVVLKDSRANYIVNAQTSDTNAYSVPFDGKPAGQMTSTEFAALQAKIVDKKDNAAIGNVNVRTALVAPVVQTQGWTNVATDVNWTAATDRTATNLEYTFSYSTNRYTGFTAVSNAKSTTKDVSSLFTTPGSYFVYVSATEDGITTTSATVEIQVIGTLTLGDITSEDDFTVGTEATVNWSPVYGREQFTSYEVYVDGEVAATVLDQNQTSANVTLPNEAGDADIYVKANFKANIGGSNFRQTETATIDVFEAPIAPVFPDVPGITAPGAPSTLTDGTTIAQAATTTTATQTFDGVIGAAATNAAVLGATDTASNNDGAAEVKGTTTDNFAAIDVNNNDGKIFGLAWFWWILILAAIAAAAWWIIGAARRRNENNA